MLLIAVSAMPHMIPADHVDAIPHGNHMHLRPANSAMEMGMGNPYGGFGGSPYPPYGMGGYSPYGGYY